MVKIVWTDEAIDDLKSIHDYISKDSINNAIRFSNKILDKTDVLINFPKSGRIVPEFGSESIRELIEGNYRIIYKMEDSLISIIRIHHSSQQF